MSQDFPHYSSLLGKMSATPVLIYSPYQWYARPGCLQIWGWKPGFWDSFPNSTACLCCSKTMPPFCSQSKIPEGFSAFSELKAGRPGLHFSSRFIKARESTDHVGQWTPVVGGQSWKFSHPCSSKKPGNTIHKKPGVPETKLCLTRHIASDFSCSQT